MELLHVYDDVMYVDICIIIYRKTSMKESYDPKVLEKLAMVQ